MAWPQTNFLHRTSFEQIPVVEVKHFTPSAHSAATEPDMVARELESAPVLYPSGQIQGIARFDASRHLTLRHVLRLDR
jgi:hypothetical protein